MQARHTQWCQEKLKKNPDLLSRATAQGPSRGVHRMSSLLRACCVPYSKRERCAPRGYYFSFQTELPYRSPHIRVNSTDDTELWDVCPLTFFLLVTEEACHIGVPELVVSQFMWLSCWNKQGLSVHETRFISNHNLRELADKRTAPVILASFSRQCCLPEDGQQSLRHLFLFQL